MSDPRSGPSSSPRAGGAGRRKGDGNEPIHPWRWRALTIWILAFSLIVGYGVRTNRELGRDGRQAHDAICVLKRNFVVRIERSREFLDEFPNGIPGLPVEVIQRSINDQLQTLKALSLVKCDPPVPVKSVTTNRR